MGVCPRFRSPVLSGRAVDSGLLREVLDADDALWSGGRGDAVLVGLVDVGAPIIDIGRPTFGLPGIPVELIRGFVGLAGLPVEAALAGRARLVLKLRLGAVPPLYELGGLTFVGEEGLPIVLLRPVAP